MGQIDVSKALKSKYPEWLSVEDILKLVTSGKTSVMRCLRVMKKREELEYKSAYVTRSIKSSNLKSFYRMK